MKKLEDGVRRHHTSKINSKPLAKTLNSNTQYIQHNTPHTSCISFFRSSMPSSRSSKATSTHPYNYNRNSLNFLQMRLLRSMGLSHCRRQRQVPLPSPPPNPSSSPPPLPPPPPPLPPLLPSPPLPSQYIRSRAFRLTRVVPEPAATWTGQRILAFLPRRW